MTLPTLSEIENFSTLVEDLPDDRPALLRNLPSANDHTALYYRFFHQFVKRWGPLNILEIGTYRGTSAAHLAWANKGGRVMTADILQEYTACAEALGIPNLRAVRVNAFVPAEMVDNPLDVIFIDANHAFNDCYDQYVRYRPFLRPGGIMFFDDLALKMAGDEMGVFWDLVVDPKILLPRLHYTGFGAAIGDPTRTPPSWEEVIPKAAEMMKARGLQLPSP